MNYNKTYNDGIRQAKVPQLAVPKPGLPPIGPSRNQDKK